MHNIIDIIYIATEAITLLIAIIVVAYSKFTHHKINYLHYVFYLLLISMISLNSHIIYSFFNEEKIIGEAIEREVKCKNEINYTTKTEEIFSEVGADIVSAKSNVYIVSWYKFGESAQGDKTINFFNELNDVASNKDKDIDIGRLLWRKSHLQAIKRHVEDYNKCSRLSLYYYSTKEADKVILPSVVLDHKIVHMGNGYLEINTQPADFRISNEEFAKSFENYFTLLKNSSVQVKAQYQMVDTNLINQLLLD